LTDTDIFFAVISGSLCKIIFYVIYMFIAVLPKTIARNITITALFQM